MKTKQIIGIGVLAVVVIVGAYYGINWYQFAETHESTDNAQVAGDISPIIPRVDGYIKRILVDDNAMVKPGDLLAEVDDADLKLKLSQEETALAAAQVSYSEARANLSYIKSTLKQADLSIAQKQDDLKRQQGLMKDGATTQQALDNTTFAYDDAVAAKASLEKQVAVAGAKVEQAQALIKQSEVAIADAQLKLSYTKLTAPIAGTVSQLNIVVGQLIRPGQTVMSVVNDSSVWVVANFKEGQIAKINPGQSVSIKVDAYGDQEFDGQVQSIEGATGSTFALLPADNASGNFVKVEQRIPVKIVFTHPEGTSVRLRPGMSVVPTVSLEQVPEESTASARGASLGD